MSPNERKFAEKNADNFYLYRVYDLGNQQGEALFYMLAGDINEQLDATPVSFKMSFKQWIKEVMLETWQEHMDGLGTKVKVDLP